MDEKVLYVDDNQNLLGLYRLQIGQWFSVDTVSNAPDALKAIEQNNYAVVMSDLRMPGMDGIELLARVRSVSPDAVRILLTANIDLPAAVAAVNESKIFRLLTKPCTTEELKETLEDAVLYYRSSTSDRDLLNKTLSGTIRLLTDVLAVANPLATKRVTSVRELARQLCHALSVDEVWDVELAAMLSFVGCLGISPSILAKLSTPDCLQPDEIKLLATHPTIGAGLLSKIPRLHNVAKIIEMQTQRYDGAPPSTSNLRGVHIPIGARILKVALDYHAIIATGMEPTLALTEMLERTGHYDGLVLDALQGIISPQLNFEHVRSGKVNEIPIGATLAEDVISYAGNRLFQRGDHVTELLQATLRTYSLTFGVREPIRYLRPETAPTPTPIDQSPLANIGLPTTSA